jgi:hypothetical protein
MHRERASLKGHPLETHPPAITRANVAHTSPIHRKNAADPLQIYLT